MQKTNRYKIVTLVAVRSTFGCAENLRYADVSAMDGLLKPAAGCPLTLSLIKRSPMSEREYFIGGVKSGRQYVVSIEKLQPQATQIPGAIRAKAAFIEFRGEKSSRAIELARIEPADFSKLKTKPVGFFVDDAQIFEILS
jgi:hypothetical protein